MTIILHLIAFAGGVAFLLIWVRGMILLARRSRESKQMPPLWGVIVWSVLCVFLASNLLMQAIPALLSDVLGK